MVMVMMRMEGWGVEQRGQGGGGGWWSKRHRKVEEPKVVSYSQVGL